MCALVRVPSLTGSERGALELLDARARTLGLTSTLTEHDLATLRAHPDHPGEEAPRRELIGLRVDLPGAVGPRLAFCGHVDVVDGGTVPWLHGDPFSGALYGNAVWGRGSADMKAGVVAALHALGALRAAGLSTQCAPSLLAVASEEDGGLGAFAALQDDAGWAGCVIPEPTGFDVVCAQAGALTFTGTVHGVAAHAAHRLQGVSAVDRYLPVHLALRALEIELNAEVTHPLMAALELPYPISIGRVSAGAWSSSVPDRLDFEGRAPVRVGEDPAVARARVEQAVLAAGEPGTVELRWAGGQFAPGQTDPDHPLARTALGAVGDERRAAPRPSGVPWGADMRLFCARGIPTVMVGTHGIELAHGVDEHVRVDEVLALARILVRIACRFDATVLPGV